MVIRLHQSKQAHATTYKALLNFKYQILSSIPCVTFCFVNVPFYIQRFSMRCDYSMKA